MPASFLKRRNTSPKAIAGSKHSSQYIGRNVVRVIALSLHNILVILKTFLMSAPLHLEYAIDIHLIPYRLNMDEQAEI